MPFKTSGYFLGLFRTVLGQVFTAWGVVFMLQANIGLEPWSVLQQGLHLVLGISFGEAVILISGAILLFDLLLKEKIGLGTVVSTFLGGIFIEMADALHLITQQHSLLSGILYMLIGLELLAIGTCVCMKAALGCGTRDALMVAISRRTKVPAGICRIVLEFTAGLLGYLMGGQLGIGTIMGGLRHRYFD